ncbi:hypothetical protein SCLCIDRAFT_1217507 [Scleroderma citrinum Foug A]|uniref:DUF6533 domain-containing protein n=1 Tax=Scleroderma citrinum Foug A TaxID=1036808 RepID=A0A0C3DUW1_9AGAM|nr:hypothetical protein SCLCIDRAFT_1217507 [Scleroderma citrinum Foug A]
MVSAYAHDEWVARSSVVVGYTLLWYDYFLTIADEVEYIWNSPWTTIKVAYLLNRYGILFGQTIVGINATGLLAWAWEHICEVYLVFIGIYQLLALESAHSLVLLRTWVIWGGHGHVLKSIVVGYVAVFVSVLAGVSSHQKEALDIELVGGICRRPVPDYVWFIYFASLVLNTLVYCMAMYSLQAYRGPSHNSWPLLIRVLVRDLSVFYFVSVFHDVMYIITWTVCRDSSKAFMPIGIALPVLAICGQRVVIDLRRVKPTVYSTTGVSEEVDRQLSALSWNMQHGTRVDNQNMSGAGDSRPDEEDTRIGSGYNRNEPRSSVE